MITNILTDLLQFCQPTTYFISGQTSDHKERECTFMLKNEDSIFLVVHFYDVDYPILSRSNVTWNANSIPFEHTYPPLGPWDYINA